MKEEKKEKMKEEKKEKMKKGRIIGYIGVVLIIAIIAYLVYTYMSSNKDKENEDGYNNEVVNYQKLVCKSSNSYDDYTTSDVISMSFNDSKLVWIYASHDYFYLSSEAFTSALSSISTTTSEAITYQSSEDYLTISAICEGDASVVSVCLTDTTDTAYINLYKYFKDKGYSCEE